MKEKRIKENSYVCGLVTRRMSMEGASMQVRMYLAGGVEWICEVVGRADNCAGERTKVGRSKEIKNFQTGEKPKLCFLSETLETSSNESLPNRWQPQVMRKEWCALRKRDRG